jgi:hypothetical protein
MEHHRASGPFTRVTMALEKFTATTWLLVILIAGVLVFSPAIFSPFLLDDYWHEAMIQGTFPSPRSAFNLYDFMGPDDHAVLLERGVLPWWSDPDLKVRFFRPLTSVLLWLEGHATRSTVVMHLHSLAWWGILVVSVHKLYCAHMSSRAALVTTLIFALAPCHAIPLVWLANREALVSLTFGALALGAWLDLLTTGPSASKRVQVFVFTSLSLLSGEYGLSMLGYLAASFLVLCKPNAARRSRELLLPAIPTVAYLGVRAWLGYGTKASGFYSDPTSNLGQYLSTAPRRAIVLFLEAFFSFDTEVLVASTWWATLLALFAAAATLAWIAWRSSDLRPLLTWSLLGAVLALPPLLAVQPSPRVVGCVVLGLAPLFGTCVEHFLRPIDSERPPAALPVVVALGFFGIVHGPGTAFLLTRAYANAAAGFELNRNILVASIGDTREKSVGVVHCVAGAFFLPFALNEAAVMPQRYRVLAQTGHVLLRRTGARAFDLIAANGYGLYPSGNENLFRAPTARLKPGYTIDVAGMRVTVVEVTGNGPSVAHFEFEKDLPSYTWLHESRTGTTVIELPEVGFGLPFE